MIYSSRMKKISQNKSLTRIIIGLVFIILVPTLFYSSYEIYNLTEYEELLSNVYQQQLETILFSINQYALDFVTSWMDKIQQALNTANPSEINRSLSVLIRSNTAMSYIVLTDTTLADVQGLSGQGELADLSDLSQTIGNRRNELNQLFRASQQGYRKTLPVLHHSLAGNSGDRLALIYIQPLDEQVKLIAIGIDPLRFITDILGPKLSEIAAERLSVGIFESTSKQAVYTSSDFQLSEESQQKKLWLFPDYVLAIQLLGKSVEDLAGTRYRTSLILVGILDLLLLFAGWFLLRNIRREMLLAQMKSDFVSNVSHELRTPLALIRMYAETLEMGRVGSDEKRQEYYQTINQESQRLTRLINNILNFSRIESGRKEYHFKPVDLNHVVNEVLTTYQYQLEQNRFMVHKIMDKNLSLMTADEESIAEVMINLLDNAIKYSPNEKEITVKTGLENDYMFLEVSDKGIGMDQRYHKMIFEKFYRISSSLVHDTKGSGLGLSLVRHIVDAHGGKIVVNSESGKGSTFRLLFPLRKNNDHT